MDRLPLQNPGPDGSVRSSASTGNLRLSLWCGCSLVLWGVCATLGWSQETKPRDTEVLLLEGNRVITGRVTRNADSYSVEQPAGTLIIAKEKVLHVTSNLHTAYVYLQDQLSPKATADEHVELARWCIGYKLIPEARFELEAALERDPSRDDIRRNLGKLDALLKQPLPEKKSVKSETPAERLAKRNTGLAEDVESLGGLSREAGQEFTRRIQPILMHNCTASACHGPKADNKFKLTLVRQGPGVVRSTTEKNLLALFPYIDREDPKSGELYQLLKSNHGAQGRSIFVGTKGKEQLAAVQTWLKSLSENGDEVAQFDPFKSKIQQTAGVAEQKPRWRKGGPAIKPDPADDEAPAPEILLTPPRSEKPGTSPRGTPTPKNTRPKSLPATDDLGPEVEPIISADRPTEIPDLPAADPFDPGEFNRRQRVKKTFGQ